MRRAASAIGAAELTSPPSTPIVPPGRIISSVSPHAAGLRLAICRRACARAPRRRARGSRTRGARRSPSRRARRSRACRPASMPLGICTIDSSESTPWSALDSTGTPSTGSRESSAGGSRLRQMRQPPAPAMITATPRASAVPCARTRTRGPARRCAPRLIFFSGATPRLVEQVGGVLHRGPVAASS